jgi:mannose/fructose/N-acetylgalactosamine-specific phosphotransferase system component IIC
MIETVSAACLLGALLWMDRVYMFQVMVSRPVVMGSILGFAMGHFETGLLAGACLELLWLNAPPVGSYLPCDESFCAAVTVPAAITACRWFPAEAAVGLALLCGLPCSMVGRKVDTWIRRMNEGLIDLDSTVGARGVSRAISRALVRSFILAAVFMGVCVSGVIAVMLAVSKVSPEPLARAFTMMPFVCLAGCISELAALKKPDIHAGMFALGLALAVFMTWIRLT